MVKRVVIASQPYTQLFYSNGGIGFEEDARGTEKYTKEYMIKYFKTLEENVKNKNINVKFDYQLARDKVISIIESLIE